MSSTTTGHQEELQHDAHGGPPVRGWRHLTAPGFIRALWMAPLFFGIGAGIVVLARLWGGWHPYWHWWIVITVGALTAAPLGFLAGIGSFDYWVRYAIGSPTQPEDHSSHGAHSWRDYFRVNTDHKVIGMQYLVTTIFFFDRRRPAGDARARRARAAGDAVLRQPDLQRPLLGPRVADDLPVRDPGVRGPRELRRAADARRARHGLPAAERALVLAAADRRDHDAGELPRAPVARSRTAGRTTRRSRPTSRSARSSSPWPSSGRARARS